MSSFKFRPRKTYKGAPTMTLDMKHSTIVQQFRDNRANLPKKKRQLAKLEKELLNLESDKSNGFSNDDIRLRATLKNDISELKKDIHNIENNEDEMDYYAKTADILAEYYTLVDNKPDGKPDSKLDYEEHQEKTSKSTGKSPQTNKKSQPEKPHKSELDILHELSQKDKPRKPTTRKTRSKSSPSGNILDFLTGKAKPVDEVTSNSKTNVPEVKEENKEKINRASLFDSYLVLTDSTYVSKKKVYTNIKMCMKPDCETELTLSHTDGMYVCRKCGDGEPVVVESDKPNFKDPTPDNSGYPYKRINHQPVFVRWLTANIY